MTKINKLIIQIVIANYYEEITNPLLNSIKKVLTKHKINYSVTFVSGAFEIPQIINHKIKKNKTNLFIAVGCIIKGQTYHFEVLSNSIAKSLLDISINNKNTFIVNGILNVNNKSQAVKRTSGKKNKGIEIAKAILSIIKCIK